MMGPGLRHIVEYSAHPIQSKSGQDRPSWRSDEAILSSPGPGACHNNTLQETMTTPSQPFNILLRASDGQSSRTIFTTYRKKIIILPALACRCLLLSDEWFIHGSRCQIWLSMNVTTKRHVSRSSWHVSRATTSDDNKDAALGFSQNY